MDVPPGMVLLPCPMRARLTQRACVAIYNSGEQPACKDCPLGPRRGAKKPWGQRARSVARMGLQEHPDRAKRSADGIRRYHAARKLTDLSAFEDRR